VVCTAECRGNDPTNMTITLRVLDESTTGGLPFAKVYFFRRAADGTVTLLGPPTSTSVTVQTSTQRTVTYSYPYKPETGLSGSFSVFGIGVTSRGTAIATAYQANTVQFFAREP
jgi:hypothetical protein